MYRSALSSTLPVENGVPVGQTQDVVRLMRGIYHLRPPQPRYQYSWQVSPVLTTIRSWGKNEDLEISRLTKKLALLLALVKASRANRGVRRISMKGGRGQGVVFLRNNSNDRCSYAYQRVVYSGIYKSLVHTSSIAVKCLPSFAVIRQLASCEPC